MHRHSSKASDSGGGVDALVIKNADIIAVAGAVEPVRNIARILVNV